MIPANRRRGRRNRQLGEVGEMLTKRALDVAGALCIERVETPWRIRRNAQGRICGATPVAMVAGDFRAVGPGGRSILAETKLREGKLMWSDIEPHQRWSLTRHADAGGLSILAWAWTTEAAECCLMDWSALIPIGFGPRVAITIEQARALHLGPGSLQ